jgi:para-nitrobenzyl esterase
VFWLDMGRLLGAAHALEIPFVFGRLSLGPATRFVFDEERREQDARLSAAMRAYWGRFAHTGDPGRGRAGDLPAWQPWSPDAGPTFLVLDTPADGGIRMEDTALTQTEVLDRVAADPRFESAEERCAVYADYVRFGGALTARAYERIDDGACEAYPLEAAGS